MPENKGVNDTAASVSGTTELSSDELDRVVGGGAIGDAAGAAQHSGLFKAVEGIVRGISQPPPIISGAAGAAGGAGPKPG